MKKKTKKKNENMGFEFLHQKEEMKKNEVPYGSGYKKIDGAGDVPSPSRKTS